MKNWKKILGLMSIAGCAVALTGNVYAADDKTCENKANIIRVEYDNGDYHCTSSLKDAIKTITESNETTGEIEFLDDKSIDRQTITKDIVINLNGNTLELNTSKGITIDSANVTIKNGTIKTADEYSSGQPFTISAKTDDASLTIADDVIYKSTLTSGAEILIANSAKNKVNVDINGTWTIKNEIINCDSNDYGKNLTVNLNAKKITGEKSLMTIDAGTSIVNILGGSYAVADGNAIELKNGTLNISGGTITTTKGHVINIKGHDSEKSETLNITGGELTAGGKNRFAINFMSKTADGTYSFAGGTYTSGKDDKDNALPAMYIGDGTFLEKQSGIITGGTYNNGIVGDTGVGTATRPAANAIKTLLGANLTYTEDEDGTITVAPAKTEDPTNPEGQGNTPDPTPTPDTTLDDSPQTYDGIMTYVTMALTSVGAVALSLKKVLSR